MSRVRERLQNMLAPPHPTFRTRRSRMEGWRFVEAFLRKQPGATIANIGSASVRLHPRVVNLDLFGRKNVDVRGDIHALPFGDGAFDALVCNGVLEHVEDAGMAVGEISRVLRCGGTAYIETPWMQGVHAAPNDFLRWTPEGLRHLFSGMEVTGIHVAAGPASALAWQMQETLAMLFSFGSELLYKIGLRVFGWISMPVSWLDFFLAHHPEAWRAASGYAFLAIKTGHRANRSDLQQKEEMR